MEQQDAGVMDKPYIKHESDDYENGIEKKAIQKILQYQPDVLMLQEVGAHEGEKTRPIISVLMEKKFHIEPDRNGNCVIALNPERFESPENISGRYFNGVKAVDKHTGEKVVFINLHLKGMMLSPKAVQKKYVDSGAYDSELAYFDKEEKEAREDVESVLQTLREKCTDSKVQIIGGDFNTPPERIKELASNRFKLLETANFRLLRSNAPTNVNVVEEDYAERELDFQLIQEEPTSVIRKVFNKIGLFFKGGIEKTATYEKIEPFGNFEDKVAYDTESHRSDHLPVFFRYTTYVRPSLPQRIKNAITETFAFISSLFPDQDDNRR